MKTEESKASVISRIRKSMTRWESMNFSGRELGRGLGRKELIDRVAQEVGKSSREVHSALK